MLKRIICLTEAGQQIVPAFALGDRVHIDGCTTITGTVIGLAVHPHGFLVQVSWWNQGALVEQWLADWRLALVKNDAS